MAAQIDNVVEAFSTDHDVVQVLITAIDHTHYSTVAGDVLSPGFKLEGTSASCLLVTMLWRTQIVPERNQ